MTENKDTRNLAEKILAVQSQVKAIPKNGYNDFHKYHYVLEADVVDFMGSLLSHERVVMLTSMTAPQVVEIGRDKFDAIIWMTTVEMIYTLINADNKDDKLEFRFFGQGADKGDKGIYKAITGAHKYFFLRAFNIPTGDDAETHDVAPHQASPAQTTERQVNNIEQLKAAQQKGFKFDEPAKPKYEAGDLWTQFKYIYNIPYKKDGYDMDEVRKSIKKFGGKFRSKKDDPMNGDNFWYTNTRHVEWDEYRKDKNTDDTPVDNKPVLAKSMENDDLPPMTTYENF